PCVPVPFSLEHFWICSILHDSPADSRSPYLSVFALNNQLTPKIERKVRKSYRFFPGLQLKDLQIPVWIAD
ncbi:TPA: hypothetical protein ACUJC3_004882, partial [Salmonella enterica]